MVLSKTPFPREGEFIIGKITDVQQQYVYVELIDYGGLPSEEYAKGMIHISEISSRWIRNIRNFVRVGQKVVLRVLRVDEIKGHVDLSLRRVNSAQKKIRMKEWKYALKFENLLQFYADEIKINLKEAYETLGFPVLDLLDNNYQEAIEELKENGERILKRVKGLTKEQKDAFLKIVDDQVEISTVSIIGKIKLLFPDSNGIDHIKETLLEAKNVVPDRKETRKLEITYIAAPYYRIEVITKDYLDAEGILSEILDIIEDKVKQYNGVYEFTRD